MDYRQKNMKKILTSIAGAAAYLSLAAPAFAQINTNLSPCSSVANGSVLAAGCRGSGLGLGQVIGFAIGLIFVVAVLIALFFLVYGGIKWITSGGDKGGVEGARNQIVAAVIGLIIVFLSFFILNLVLGMFGLSIFNLVLPVLGNGTI